MTLGPSNSFGTTCYESRAASRFSRCIDDRPPQEVAAKASLPLDSLETWTQNCLVGLLQKPGCIMHHASRLKRYMHEKPPQRGSVIVAFSAGSDGRAQVSRAAPGSGDGGRQQVAALLPARHARPPGGRRQQGGAIIPVRAAHGERLHHEPILLHLGQAPPPALRSGAVPTPSGWVTPTVMQTWSRPQHRSSFQTAFSRDFLCVFFERDPHSDP